MTRGSVESLLQGISDRQAKVGDFLSEKDDRNPITGAREGLPPYVDRVKRNEDFKNLLAFLYQEVKNFPTYPHLQEEALKRIHDRVLERMVLLMENLEAIKEAGLPAAAGMAREEREIQSEYIFLSYIYAGRVADIEDIKAEMAAYATMAAASADAPLDFDPIDGVDPSIAFGPPIDFDPVDPPVGPPPKSPDVDPSKDKEPRPMPNDFFAYLRSKQVPDSVLLRNAPEGLTDDERDTWYREKYRLLGDIYISLILNNISTNIEIENLNAPSLGAASIGSFPEAINKGTSYNASTLLYQVAYGTERLDQNESKYATELMGKLDKIFTVLGGIKTISDRYKSATSSLEALSKFSTPLPNKDSGQEKTPSYFDDEFWTSLLQTGDGPSEMGDTHFMYQLKEGDPGYDPDDEDGNWRPVEYSMADQFTRSHHLLKETARFPHQRNYEQYGRVKAPLAFRAVPKSIRPGTKYLLRRENGLSHYRVKTVFPELNNGDTSFVPYIAEQAPVKPKRIKALKGVVRSLSRDAATAKKEELSSTYMTIHAANTIHSWLTADKMGSQLKGWATPENLGIRRPTNPDGTLARKADGSLVDVPISDADIEQFFTDASYTVDLGPGGLGLEGYDAPFVINNLTMFQVRAFEGKISPYVLGVTVQEKAMNPGDYALKSIGGEEEFESHFQVKAIGMIRGFLFPYDEYYVDWETGLTVGELLEEYDRPGRSPLGSKKEIGQRILKLLGPNSSQNWSLHLKDGIYLTKTLLEPNSKDTINPPTNIAKVNIEQNKIEDLQESFIATVRTFGRVLKGYHLGRDLKVPTEVQKVFFMSPEDKAKLPDDAPRYENIGRHAMVIRVVDGNNNVIGQMLTRVNSQYHITPQDLMMVTDIQGMTGNAGVDFYSKRVADTNGVMTFEVKLPGYQEIPAYKKELERDKFDLSTPEGKSLWANEYIENMLLRHMIFRVFFYGVTQGDEWKNLDMSKLLLFGMVFSPEMRHKFETNQYTRGSISRTFIDAAKTRAVFRTLFGEQFGNTEVPDLAADDLLTEELYMRLLHDVGYVSNLSDDFLEKMSKAVEQIFKGRK